MPVILPKIDDKKIMKKEEFLKFDEEIIIAQSNSSEMHRYVKALVTGEAAPLPSANMGFASQHPQIPTPVSPVNVESMEDKVFKFAQVLRDEAKDSSQYIKDLFLLYTNKSEGVTMPSVKAAIDNGLSGRNIIVAIVSICFPQQIKLQEDFTLLILDNSMFLSYVDLIPYDAWESPPEELHQSDSDSFSEQGSSGGGLNLEENGEFIVTAKPSRATGSTSTPKE